MTKQLVFVWVATLALCVGVAQTGRADVTGLFAVNVTLFPQTTTQEAIPFFVDLQSNLQVHVTISGLTLSTDLGFGNTGLEFAVVTLGTNLGALAIQDQFVFAPPFGCSAPGWIGVAAGLSDNTDGGIAGQCPPMFVSPIGSSALAENAAGIAFVKKRVDMQLDIAGISLGVLALFEDVDFPDIHGAKSTALIGAADGSDHEHDHFLASDLYFVGANDTTVDNQTPSFGFGAILTLNGQTVSGITVTGITGICADNAQKNRIKKRKFEGEVDKACVSDSGPMFAFNVEKLHIEGIKLGGVNISNWLEFRPALPTSGTLDLSFSVAGLADAKATFMSQNLLSFVIDLITVSFASPNFSLVMEDVNADLKFDRGTAKLSLTLNPNQNPAAFTTTTVAESGIGVTSELLELTITRAGLTMNLATQFVQNGTGLSWDNTNFLMSTKLDSMTFSSDVLISSTGLRSGTLNLSVNF